MTKPLRESESNSAKGLCIYGPVTERPKVNSLEGYQSFTIHRGFESHPGLCLLPRRELALSSGLANPTAEATWSSKPLLYGFGVHPARKHANESTRTARSSTH